MSTEPTVDVFISGAGPVGLLLAHQLTQLNISTYVVDSANKASPDFPMYGRACSLYPRTLEMLDQLDLYDDLAQIGLTSNRSWTYRDGKKVFGRGWDKIMGQGSTFFDFILNVRLKFSEDVFRERLAEKGVEVHAPLKLVAYIVDEMAPDDYKVLVTCERPNGETVRVRSKYIAGADGGRSAVRKIAKIPFPGLHNDKYWVRIDAIVKTDIPEARHGFGAIESPTHGHTLWVALDHGATRIGYVLGDELSKKYGRHMTQEEAVYEAQIACAPFKVEFEDVHWQVAQRFRHTVYSIQQHVADRFVDRNRIVIAGEAAHTHSSGTAQGMNTGVHDVVNLGWRLAGVIKGWYKQPVLQNYSDERGTVARELIDNDKVISMLISGQRPDRMKDRKEDPMVLLDEFLAGVRGFTNGLGIAYPGSILNDIEHALPDVKMPPGHRATDARLHKAGFRQQTVRLHEVTKYNGKFRILVFTGQPRMTASYLHTLRSQVDKHRHRFAHAVDFITIVEGSGQAFDEALGLPKFGNGYWDIDSSAHWTYGVGGNLGAVVVLRPDGIVGASSSLERFEDVVVPYLERLVHEREVPKQTVSSEIGELINANENNLEFSKRSALFGTDVV